MRIDINGVPLNKKTLILFLTLELVFWSILMSVFFFGGYAHGYIDGKNNADISSPLAISTNPPRKE